MAKIYILTLLSSLMLLNTAQASLFCTSSMDPDFRVEITIPDLRHSEAIIHEYRFYNLEKTTTKSTILAKETAKQTKVFFKDYQINKQQVLLVLAAQNARLEIGKKQTLGLTCKFN